MWLASVVLFNRLLERGAVEGMEPWVHLQQRAAKVLPRGEGGIGDPLRIELGEVGADAGHLPTACTSGVANQRRRSARSILIQRPSSRRWTQSSSCGDFGAAGSSAGLARPGRPSMPSGAKLGASSTVAILPSATALRSKRVASARSTPSSASTSKIAWVKQIQSPLATQTFRDPCPARSFVPPYRGAVVKRKRRITPRKAGVGSIPLEAAE